MVDLYNMFFIRRFTLDILWPGNQFRVDVGGVYITHCLFTSLLQDVKRLGDTGFEKKGWSNLGTF